MQCATQRRFPGVTTLSVPIILFCLTLHATDLPDDSESDLSEDDISLMQLHKVSVRRARSRNNHRSPQPEQFGYIIDLEGYNKSSGLVDLYTDPENRQDLVLDVTDLVLNKTGANLRITATAGKGAYVDGWGFQQLLHEPLEEDSSPLYQLELSMEKKMVNVRQPQLTLRSSDPKTKNAFNAVNGDGMLIGQVSTLTTSLPADRIAIDGIELIQYGFFVAPQLFSTIQSYEITHVKSYKTNFDVTLRLLDIYSIEKVVTFSVILLPETPMPARVNDDRLMYFTVDYQDMGVHTLDYEKEMRADDINKEIDPVVSVIWRYDLTKGPIRIHVDPSVPQEWRTSFKKGVEDWNAAFELAGHPGAIKAVLPGDADWPADYDAGDARISTISWALNLPDVFSEGIAKVDPRTGEIIKGDVVFTQGWVLSWLVDLEVYDLHQTHKLSKGYRHERRRRQDEHSTARLNPSVQEPRRPNKSAILDGQPILLQESVAGHTESPANFKERGKAALLALGVPERSWYQAIQAGLRDVVRHEVGHLLGLRHNFKGSAGISYECTQNMTCSSLQGLTTSVMDYLPMNTPSKGTKDVHLFSPCVGAYDKLAIRYGYTDVKQDEQQNGIPIIPPELKKILSEADAIPFCTDGDRHTNGDPLCELYDLSADPLVYWEDQILLLKKLTQGLFDRAVAPGESYSHFGARVSSYLRKAFSIQVSLSQWLGGVIVSRAHRPSAGSDISPPLQAIPINQQRKALHMMLELLEPEKAGILPPMDTLSLMSEKASDSFHRLHLFPIIRRNQQTLLHSILDSDSLIDMDEGKDLHGFSVKVLLSDLLLRIMGDTDGSKLRSSTHQEWDLQMDFIDSLLQKRAPGELPEDVALDIAWAIRRLKNTVEESLRLTGKHNSKSEQLRTHLMTVNHKLHDAAKDMGFLSENAGVAAFAHFWLWPCLMVRVLAAC